MTKFKTLIGLALLAFAGAAQAADLTVHKSPWCGCCAKWIDHVAQHGFTVKVIETEQIAAVKKRLGVPDSLGSCHTSQVGGYFVEGHVPAADIQRLLKLKPKARGIAVAGMPAGSPGMETSNPQPYSTMIVDKAGKVRLFARH
ncbi:MAG TPA: DUF411 domain-containing protein [Sphingomicrobium sp.]|nr:DUF411 domain-containing protein [Sphingomicrobium sp.]